MMKNDLIRTELQTAPRKLFLLGTLTVIREKLQTTMLDCKMMHSKLLSNVKE
jgi:hypothetical protein